MRWNDQAQGLRVARRNENNSIRAPQRVPGSSTHSIAITSGKGGVGKTQLAANLAVAIAQRGQRVVLLDADLGLASLDLALGIRPTKDLRSVLHGESRIEDIIVEAPSGVYLMPACPGRYEMANLEAPERDLISKAVWEAAREFDVLIIDTGAGIGSNAVDFAALADTVLLVATPDPTSLRDAYAMAKVLHKRNGIDRLEFIANQVNSETEGATLHARIQSIIGQFMTLELNYLGAIPRDATVRESVTAGEPYVLRTPRSQATRAVQGLARRLFPQTAKSELC